MKTNFKFTVGGFTLNKVVGTAVNNSTGEVETQVMPVDVPAIDVEGSVEYTAGEMLDMWRVYKTVMEESPEVLGTFATKLVEEYYKAYEKVMPLHKQHDEELRNESC